MGSSCIFGTGNFKLSHFVMMLNDVSLSCTMLLIDVLFMAYSNKVMWLPPHNGPRGKKELIFTIM